MRSNPPSTPSPGRYTDGRSAGPDAWREPRVVALGGGTGLPIVLEGLRHALFAGSKTPCQALERDRLTAIVTVADDGGSSGRLRQAYGVLPPGDIRNCMLALADRDSPFAALFSYRFGGDHEISGHSLGNLILTALSHLEQDFSRAIERGGEILGVHGQVFPATAQDIRLCAQFEDGSWIQGESRVASGSRVIRRVVLEPPDPDPIPEALEAARTADVVVIGPGSLYTSLIPVLLVRELTDAIRRSGARVVLVMNLTTEPGETDGYTAADHLLAIRRHAPELPIHDVLLNDTPISPAQMQAYVAAGATLVGPDTELLRALGHRPVMRELVGAGPKIRHDPRALAGAILELAREAHERPAATVTRPAPRPAVRAR